MGSISDEELDTFTVAFKINNTVKMCSICERQRKATFPDLKEVTVCEGCKHQIFNYHDIGVDMVAPFHVNKIGDFVVHTLETCLLVSKWNRVKVDQGLGSATPDEIVELVEVNDDNAVLLQNRISA